MHGPASVSTDGSRIAFSSDAPDLVANDTNGLRDLFVRDLVSGTTIPVSVATNGSLGDSISLEPSISGDGRYVAFTSWATNLIENDINRTSDVFVRDLLTGTTQLISVNPNGSVANGASYSPVISLDGTRVVFLSKANDLAPGLQQYGANLVLRDLNAGVTYALTTKGADAFNPAASRGRYIFYAGYFPTNGLYLWDSQLHAVVYSNITVHTSYTAVAVSPDGNHLAYAPGSGRFAFIDRTGTGGAGATVPRGVIRSPPQFSDDGRFVAYPGTTGLPQGKSEIYLFDFQTRSDILLSWDFDSTDAGNGTSDSPSISGDGRFVAYRSDASNLVPVSNSFTAGMFLYDRLSGVTTLVSSSSFDNQPADSRSTVPVFSGDSRTLFFRSWASALVPNDFNQNADIFAYNLYPSNSIAPFAVQVLPSASSSAVLTWLAAPGRTYTVLAKSNLLDPSWQTSTGRMTFVGNRAYFAETAPAAPQRFYRVIGN